MRTAINACQLLPALALGLLLALAGWIYAPGASGPPLLDDFSSLGALDHLGDSPHQALDYVLGDSSGPLGRSVSMATFVLEQLLGDGSVGTRKWVNIGLHLLTGGLAAWFFALLLAAVGAPRAGLAAACIAGIWLLAPLQVSTVLYLVQRMAMLACLFTVLSLVCYLHWRRGLSAGQPRLGWLLASGLALLLGTFAKENALVGLPLILLTEACWLQCEDARGRRLPRLQQVTYGLIGLGTLALVLLVLTQWSYFELRHHGRDFTLQERLLTQPRILWDYVAQFFAPDTGRLGIFHDDFRLSRGFEEPATRAAILGWGSVLLAVGLLWRWPAGRRLAYGPLFFLAGHSIESSVLPLELYFEHRNYLPGLGLVLLPLGCYALLSLRWKQVSAPLLAWVGVYLLYLCALTGSQVQIWSKAPLLAMQAINGHPESARANREYATQLARVGARDAALEYSARAHFSAMKYAAAGDEYHGDYVLRDVALACLARQPLHPFEYRELGRYQPGRPLGEVATLSVVSGMRYDKVCPGFDWQGLLDHLATLYLVRFDTSLASANMFTALAILANASGRWDDAYQYVERSLALEPGRTRELLMQLHFSVALGREKEAEKLIVELQARQDAGKLNRGEQDTLALYLGG